MGKYLNRYFLKEEIQMAKKHKERCSTPLGIRKLNLHTTWYHFIPIEMLKNWNCHALLL